MAMTVSYPPRLELARTPTPLQLLTRLSAQEGGPRIWVKRDDLTECVASGNKIRKLEFTLAQALAEGADTVITCGGVQSNHCRATAVLGARLGLNVHLILRGDKPAVADGNLFLDQLCGASVSFHPAPLYQQGLGDLFAQWSAHYQAQGRRVFIIPTGASDGIGVWGYIACAGELRDDFAQHGIAPKYIVHATGSGGTQAGLSAGVVLHGIDASVIGMAVCDNEAYFLAKVRADLEDWKQRYGVGLDPAHVPLHCNDHYIGEAYAKADASVFATIHRVAALEGLVLDPVYTGKAFHGMLMELRAGAFSDSSDIVFVHTGGVYGLFAQREQALRDCQLA
jgi:D-cysteine desulfhydrase